MRNFWDPGRGRQRGRNFEQAQEHVEDASSSEEHCVVLIHSAVSLDRTHSRVLAALRLTDGLGNPKSRTVHTTPRMKTANPVWRAPRDLLARAEPDDVLIAEICSPDWNKPLFKAHARIGELERQEDLAALPLWRQMQALQQGRLLVRRLTFDPWLHSRRCIFLIRHAQSRWNEAREARNYPGLMAFDHPLTSEGIKQCEELRGKWLEACRLSNGDHQPEQGDLIEVGGMDNLSDPREGAGDSDEALWAKAFARADLLVSSPLTRAVETAVVALEGHQERKLRLQPNAREAKGRGGLDSVGKCMGREIVRRCEEKLKESMGPERARECLASWTIDTEECESEWWTGPDDADSDEEVDERVRDLLQCLCFSAETPASSAVVVGHSNLFLRLCRTLGIQETIMGKLGNAGIVGIDVAFGSHGDARALDYRLMFGSSTYPPSPAPQHRKNDGDDPSST